MKIDELRDELAQVTTSIEDIYKLTATEKRELSDPEQAEVDGLLGRGNQIKSLIQQNERVSELKDWGVSPQGDPEKPDALNASPMDRKSYRSLGEQLLSVCAAQGPGNRVDSRLFRATGMGEGIPTDGGFLVQTDFSDTLMNLVWETGLLASRCDQLKVGAKANRIVIPGINETDRADGSRQGGIQAYWGDEGGTKTPSNATIRKIELTLGKLTALTYTTDELLSDATALESYIKSEYPKEIGFKVDDGIINGPGGARPLGILTHGGLVSVAAEVGQLAATVIAENIMKMYARMLPSSISKAVWLINQEVWQQLFALSLPMGTAGFPLFMPPGELSSAPFGTLMGRPIIPIEQCAALGTVGDIIFADMSMYYFADKSGIQSAESIHVQFVTDETAFRWVYRCDGQPKLASPITPFNGTATLSPFVALVSRT